jgi:acetoin utilization deacetylase AcuC-like enzyme
MRNGKIKTFYRKEMSLNNIVAENYSMSPNKPKLFMEHIEKRDKKDLLVVEEDFDPFSREDFYMAHTRKYVDSFFDNIPNLNISNRLKWTPEFANTVKYTNSSLYEAIKHSIEHPEIVSFSPSSGFHHSTPGRGHDFCTFSGQVIASTKIYREYGLSGAYIDLDAHYGNSIDDSMNFIPDLKESIKFNINPRGKHSRYINNLSSSLKILEKSMLDNKVHYLVFAHGADSAEGDELGGQLTEEEWIKTSEIVYDFIGNIDSKVGRPFPLTISLFGGYRKNYEEVLDLHLTDIEKCHDILCKN